jgi:hypothetical protein
MAARLLIARLWREYGAETAVPCTPGLREQRQRRYALAARPLGFDESHVERAR